MTDGEIVQALVIDILQGRVGEVGCRNEAQAERVMAKVREIFPEAEFQCWHREETTDIAAWPWP